MYGGGRNRTVALHLYSMECDVSKKAKMRDLITVPSPDSTKSPSLTPPSVTIRFPISSYQSTVGVFWRWGDFLTTQRRVKLLPSRGVVGEVVTSADKALSGSTETWLARLLVNKILSYLATFYLNSNVAFLDSKWSIGLAGILATVIIFRYHLNVQLSHGTFRWGYNLSIK